MSTNRKTIVLSGGRTTQGLTEKLVDRYDIAILEPQIATAHQQRFGSRVIPIIRLIDQPLQNQALNLAAQLATTGIGALPFVVGQIQSQDEWARFRGNGFAHDISQWFPVFLHTSLSRQISQLLALDRLLQSNPVAMVITHEDVTEAYGGLTAWGNARGVPTMHIPHGNSFMQRDYSPDIHEQSIASCIAATPHMEAFYRERGYAGEVRLTGSPMFDHWHDFKIERDYARRMLQLDLQKPVVVYLGSWGQKTNANDDLTMFERAFDAMMIAARESEWQLVISLHPGEAPRQEENYIARATALGTKCVVIRQYFEFLLASADAIVGVAPSNAMIDGALMGVPAISLNCIGFRMNHPAVREIEADAQAIRQEIAFLLSEEGGENWESYRDDFVCQMAFKNDGMATDRVVQWIDERVNLVN